MPITLHQTKVKCNLLGEVNLCFTATGPSDNPDFDVTSAWVDVAESSAVVALNKALTRTSYSRTRSVDLPRELHPILRNGAWDDMQSKMDEDRELGRADNFMDAAE